MLTREIVIKTVHDFIKSCQAVNINFDKVILFGSAVKDNMNDFSDIDLLLVSDQFGYSKWENAKLIARINKKYSSIEAHTYPTDYFLEEEDPFIKEVVKTGIELYDLESGSANTIS